MSTIEYITAVVHGLNRRHRTRDLYALCAALGIRVRQKDMGNAVKAFFVYQSRIKSIVLNRNIGSDMQRILAAHELGHAVLHGEIAMMRGFQEIELFDATQKAEYEANLFAAELLIEDDQLLELLNDDGKSFFSMAKELNIPAALLDFKFRVIKHKGYRIEAPYIAHRGFLKHDIDGCYADEFSMVWRRQAQRAIRRMAAPKLLPDGHAE